MSRTLRQAQTGTLRPVVKYSGERKPSPPSIDQTQPMEGTEAIGGAESEDTTYSSALLPRIEQLPPGHRRGRNRNGSSHRAMDRPDPMRVRPPLVRPPDGQDRPLPPVRDDGGRRTDAG